MSQASEEEPQIGNFSQENHETYVYHSEKPMNLAENRNETFAISTKTPDPVQAAANSHETLSFMETSVTVAAPDNQMFEYNIENQGAAAEVLGEMCLFGTPVAETENCATTGSISASLMTAAGGHGNTFGCSMQTPLTKHEKQDAVSPNTESLIMANEKQYMMTGCTSKPQIMAKNENQIQNETTVSHTETSVTESSNRDEALQGNTGSAWMPADCVVKTERESSPVIELDTDGVDEEDYVFFPEPILDKWKNVGRKERLSSNTAIAEFLIEL
jgi:hypothetical protein